MVKIMIGIAMLFMVVGMVYATDINKLKCPEGWESAGNGMYHEIGDSSGLSNGRNMIIMDYTPDNCDEFFENVTEESYYVFKNNDNTYNFTDYVMNKDEGCFEVVEIDGKQYFLLFSSNIDNDYKDCLSVYDSMLEFNKLNNLKPIAV